MNRRLKLLVALLLGAALCLSAAIISFRLSGARTEQEESGVSPSAGSTAIILFEGANGLKGARTANGRVLIEPTWYYLRTMSDSVLIAKRSGDKSDLYGLIRTNGEIIVPFLYRSFYQADNTGVDLWFGSFEENGKQQYHLYRADGTRRSDTAWDSCSYSEGVLTLGSGANRWEAIPTDTGIRLKSWHTEYPVGLHSLVTDFDETALAHLPDADTLMRLGETAADYLSYLFVTKKPPDASQISAESVSAIRVDLRYISCRLSAAEISRIRILENDGLPSYLVQMKVRYQRPADDGTVSVVDTAMLLTVNRNTAGDFTYSAFSDLQMNAANGDLIN